MTRKDFLDRLREALSNDLGASLVEENADYYNQYILDEVKNGKSEEEVIEELGDPWVIARTIIGAAEGTQGAGTAYVYESDGQGYGQDSYTKRIQVSGRSWWSSVVMILGIIGVLIAVVAVVGGIISLVAPIILPLIIIMVIIRRVGRRR